MENDTKKTSEGGQKQLKSSQEKKKSWKRETEKVGECNNRKKFNEPLFCSS